MTTELMLRAQAGDIDAFGELYARHRLEVLAFVARRHPYEAEDIASEVWAKALKALPSWQDQGRPPISWLMTIAANLCHSVGRSAHYRLSEPSPNAGADLAARPVDSDPELLAVRAMQDGAVSKALAALTPDQRRVVVLHHLRDLKVRQVAAEVGASRQAVASMLFRARAAMRPMLAGVADA